MLYAGEPALRLTDLVMVDTDADGMPDWWEDQSGLNKTNSADAALDSDGDGVSNAREFIAGTDPANPASIFRILSLQREASDLRVTWSAVGGRRYAVQAPPAPPDGSFSNNFADLGSLITVPGSGESTANFVDRGAATNTAARYYRIRLVP